MRLGVFSDIHLEGRDNTDWRIKPNAVDVVVLAGDIHTKARGVDWAKKTFSCPVIYVLGNHDAWGGHWENTIKKMKDKARGSNVHVLNDDSVVIDGVRFIGSTLWSCFSTMGMDRQEEVMREAAKGKDPYSSGLRDYRHIRTGSYRRIKPMDVYKWNKTSKEFIENELARKHDGPSIVVSHHAPLPRDVLYGLEYKDILYAGDYNDMSKVIKQYNPTAWIFGHTHIPIHDMFEKTALISHPIGYDNDQFKSIHNNVVVVDKNGCNVIEVPGLFDKEIPMQTVIRNK